MRGKTSAPTPFEKHIPKDYALCYRLDRVAPKPPTMTRRCINPALYAIALRAKALHIKTLRIKALRIKALRIKALRIKALRIKAPHIKAPHIKVLHTKHFSPKPYGKPMGLLEKRSF